MLKDLKTAPNEVIGNIPDTPLRFIFAMSKPHKWWFISAVALVTTASAIGQSTSYFFKLIVDSAEAGDLEKVMLFALLFPVTLFGVQLLFRLSGYFGMQSVTRIMKTGTDSISNYTFYHSHNYFLNRFAGSIMTKYGNVVGAMGEIIPEMLWTHLTALVSFVITFLFIAFVDINAALAFFGLAVTLIVFNRQLAPRKREYSRAHAESRTVLNGRTIDILSNISAVRQFARVEEEFKGMQALTADRYIKHQRNWFYTEKMLVANSFILFVFGGYMFWSLVNRWSDGFISTGDLVLVLALISQITGTLIFIGRAINETARAFGEMEEGLDDLLKPYDIIDAPNATTLTVPNGKIEWQRVNFQHGEQAVFQDFNLTIPAGQRLGLVGSSGAGKSTFVSLLLRQHDLQSGTIAIDGQPIHEVTQDSLRASIAVVPQEPALFHRTIRENIAYGKPDATDEEIEEVAKKAFAHDFIITLPEGYNTLVGERGVKLSGGQKQRIAIARAMLKDAPILILDEATSALDSESEAVIQKALHILMAGKTVIAIAHRLSTLREMDRIVVLDQGKIIEDGSHDALLQYNGTYAKLWAHQAGGFVGEK